MHTAIQGHQASGGIAAVGMDIRPTGARRSEVRVLHKDAELFSEGEKATHYYQVVSGAVRTSKILLDGRRQIDAFHLPGDIFGVEAGEEHRFCAEAVCDASVKVFRRCSLETLAIGDADLARQVVAAMMLSLARAQDHMLLLGRKSAAEKIATFLLDFSCRAAKGGLIELPMSRTDIADYLGLTIETVSRSLTRLERLGVIAVPSNRRAIVVRDRAALEQLDA